MPILQRALALASIAGVALTAGCSSFGGRSTTPKAVSGLPPGMQAPDAHALSPAHFHAGPMAKTRILPPSAMVSSRRKPKAAILPPNWQIVPGTAAQVVPSPDGSLWALSDQPSTGDKFIWHYVSGAWTNISGMASRLATAPDGTLYAVNSTGGIYEYVSGSWTNLPGSPGGAADISIQTDGFPDPGMPTVIMQNGGKDGAIFQYTNGTWTKLPGSGIHLAASWDSNSYTIPAGTINASQAPGVLWVINSPGGIYCLSDGGYIVLPGLASKIAAPSTGGGYLVLGYPGGPPDPTLYYYNLDTPGYTMPGGSGMDVGSGDGMTAVTNSQFGIYISVLAATQYTTGLLPNASPQGMTRGPDGAMWFTDIGNSAIGRITTAGVITNEYPTLTPEAVLTSIALGSDNNLWFTEQSFGQIGRVTPSGTVTEFPTGSTVSVPTTIAPGPDGNLWFTETGANAIGTITTSGAVTVYSTGITTNAGLGGIAAGPDGNLWFTERDANKIGQITTAGVVTEFSAGLSSNAVPTSIVGVPGGALWFTEPQNNKIGEITTSGVITEFSAGQGGSSPYGIGPAPNDITLGSDGALWYTETGLLGIGRMTQSGSVTEYSAGITPNSTPSGIALGPDSALWFAEYTGGRIGRIQ
jgi:streptogramin lyase